MMSLKTWKVWGVGTGLAPLFIVSEDADEALNYARQVNKNYDAVQLYSVE